MINQKVALIIAIAIGGGYYLYKKTTGNAAQKSTNYDNVHLIKQPETGPGILSKINNFVSGLEYGPEYKVPKNDNVQLTKPASDGFLSTINSVVDNVKDFVSGLEYGPTRGVRNNNPGNIRKGEKWIGLSTEQPDSDFATFINPAYGIRALVKTLRTYSKKYGLNTIRGIVNRWAPASENDSLAYVQSVVRQTGSGPDTSLDLNDKIQMDRLVKAIIKHENGDQPYSNKIIREGIILADTNAPAPVYQDRILSQVASNDLPNNNPHTA